MDLDLEAEVGAEDVRAEEPTLAHLRQRGREARDHRGAVAADVHVPAVCAHRVGGDDQPFEDGVRVTFHQGRHRERHRVVPAGVADHVLLRARRFRAEEPSVDERRPGGASFPDIRRTDFRPHGRGREPQRPLQTCVSWCGSVIPSLVATLRAQPDHYAASDVFRA